MKKRNATALSEILYQDINKIGDFTEDFQKLLFQNVLGLTSGVITGLNVSLDAPSGVFVAAGSMVDSSFAYGELEGVSGVSLETLPEDGSTRYDIVTAKYLEIADSPGASYVLIDVESRTQSIQNVYRRKFGSIVIEIIEDTTSGALTGGRIPLAQLEVTSGGIDVITDLRQIVKPTNVDLSNVNVDAQKIQGIDVDTTNPTDGQVLTYISASGAYVAQTPASAPTSLTQGGDISGTTDNATVDKIKNIPISGGTAELGKALVHDGVNLAWTSVPTGNVDLTAIPTGNIANLAEAIDDRAAVGQIGSLMWDFKKPTTTGTWVPCNGESYSRSTYSTMAGYLGSYTEFTQVATVSPAGGYEDGIYANGVYLFYSDAGTSLYRSTNGTSFSTVSPGGSFSSSRTRFAWDGTYFLMVNNGAPTTIWYSTDGSSWSTKTSATTNTTVELASDGAGKSVVVCLGGEIRSSTNPTTWTSRTAGVSSSNFATVIYGAAAGFVAVTTDKKVTVSADGETWSASTPAEWASGLTGNPSKIAYVNNTYVLLTTTGQLWKSSNGTSWTRLTNVPQVPNILATAPLFGVADNKLFLNLNTSATNTANDIYLWTSDLENWTFVQTYETNAGNFVPLGLIKNTVNDIVFYNRTTVNTLIRSTTSSSVFYVPRNNATTSQVGIYPFIRIG